MELSNIILAVIGGMLPALVWLWFWIHEDSLHPEPKRLLLLTFIAGGITVALAIPLQQMARDLLGGTVNSQVIAAWASIEEILKYLVALSIVLWRKAVDEPIDMLIYMITIALGFSAIENTLFLIAPIMTDGIASAVITGNFRFFGATLLHLLSSSIVGVALALSFYKEQTVRITYTAVGVILAIILHTSFNLFILESSTGGIVKIFAFVWLGIVVLLLFFEKIKKMKLLTNR